MRLVNVICKMINTYLIPTQISFTYDEIYNYFYLNIKYIAHIMYQSLVEYR